MKAAEEVFAGVFGEEAFLPPNPLLDAALTYADMGWEVFPTHNGPGCSCWKGERCTSKAKHPRTRNGVMDATTDMNQIENWWRMWPLSNVGIRTGKNLLVLDLDGDEGSEVLHSWITRMGEASNPNAKGSGFASALVGMDEASNANASLTPTPNTNKSQRDAFLTPRSITGNGMHLYFSYPEQARFRAQVGVMPGVDIRVGDSYVIAPPSVHASGKTYEWEVDHSPVTDLDLAPVPEIVVRVLSQTIEPKKPKVPKRIKIGKRNDLFYRLAASFWASEIPEDIIERVLVELLPRTQQAPGDAFDETDVHGIVERVTNSYPPGKSSDRARDRLKQVLKPKETINYRGVDVPVE